MSNLETPTMITTKLKLTAGSDPSRIGSIGYMHSNGQQAMVQDSNGATIVDWTTDVRFGTTTVIEKKIPTWAIILGIIGLLCFLLGIVFFFVKTDHPVERDTVTVFNDADKWITGVLS